MMSKRRDVQLALKALIEDALAYARVKGFDDDPVKPDRADPGGDILGYPGSAGNPEVTLSPVTFHYDHEMVLEVSPPPGGDPGETLDDMLGAIGDAIAADRTLGGLADWMEAAMPDMNDRDTEGASGTPWARLPVIVSYSTADPLN
jgi:hypothetical protein